MDPEGSENGISTAVERGRDLFVSQEVILSKFAVLIYLRRSWIIRSTDRVCSDGESYECEVFTKDVSPYGPEILSGLSLYTGSFRHRPP